MGYICSCYVYMIRYVFSRPIKLTSYSLHTIFSSAFFVFLCFDETF